tara:strand:- start:918 stop:2822 length:1905 start_codon:yes stop_codon:yes gene_type:complete
MKSLCTEATNVSKDTKPKKLTRAQKREQRQKQRDQKKADAKKVSDDENAYIACQAKLLAEQNTYPKLFTLKDGTILYIMHQPVNFGCPASTDADVAVEIKCIDPKLVDEKTCDKLDQRIIERQLLPIIYKYIEILQKKNQLDLKDKEVDLCCFEINYGKKEICWGSKGTNINLQFYLHFTSNRTYNTIIECPSIKDVDKPTQMLQACKIILKQLESIVDDRSIYVDHYREDKKIAFANGNETIAEYGLELMQKFKVVQSNRDNTTLISLWKTITMKIIQSYLIHKEFNGNMYTKEKMIQQFSIHFPTHSEGVRILLLRQLNNPDVAIPHETIDLLINICTELIEKYVYPPEPIQTIDVSDCPNPTHLDNQLITEFKKSPQDATDKFCQIFSGTYDTGNLNDAFISGCSHVNCLPRKLQKRIYTDAPKSTAWTRLLKQHECGRNSGVIPIPLGASATEKVAFRYNLIRGCIGEDIATYFIKNGCLNSILGILYITVIIGLIVESKVQLGSRGCAPDIIIKTFLGKLIPIEIKTIYGKPTRNSHFTRAMYLANRQVQTCLDLIGNQNIFICYEIGFKLMVSCIIGYIINNTICNIMFMLYIIYVLHNQYKTIHINGLIVIVWVHESQILMEVFQHT